MTRPLTRDLEAPGQQAIAVMVTRRCNMTCAHCSVESGPAVGSEPTEGQLLDWMRQAAAAGVRTLRITGGEPMLRESVVLKLIRECRRLGVATAINTNGFWGYSPEKARRQLRGLRRAGIGAVTVSYDRYHADFQGPDPALHIAQAAQELSIPLNLSVVRDTDEGDLAAIANRLEPARGTRLRVYDLQLVGRAREFPPDSVRADADGFCTSCSYPLITDDGRLIACTGPAYFEKAESPLVLGSLQETPLAELLDRHRQDPILNVIRTRGPAGLREELLRTPGFEAFPFRSHYFGICDLCHHITQDPSAVAALRHRLGRPEAVAAQLAAWQVIAGHRRQGELSASYVNGVGAGRLFLRAAAQPSAGFDRDAGRILGHAHLDWRMLSDYLCGSGLARPLLGVLGDTELKRWAPAFFRDELSRRALRDGLRELVQREAIEQIADGLRTLGGRGVLLKGAALFMRAPDGVPSRSTSDIDVFVEPSMARRLRTQLLARGFEGAADAGASTFHHLEPIAYQGVPVEIHTRIMPGFWGLPEAQLLADARPLPGSDVLGTLGPEALVLHSATHLTASFFSFGLKTAWDLLTVIQGEPDFDWPRLASWAAASRAPRAFWMPLRVLASELELPVPFTFLKQAPADRDARRLEIVARRRIFRATEGLFDLDILTKTGLMLLVHDSWPGRARYLVEQLRWRGGRPGTWSDTVARAKRADLLRQAWRQYRRYRRAVASLPVADGSE
ncbi:MAG: nucleotidyltransferase family protein [Vicinamibacterales bacterium]